MRICLSLIFASLVGLTMAQAPETSQWRGPDRNGIYPETGLLKSWPANGPKLLWHFEGLVKDLHRQPSLRNIFILPDASTEKDIFSAWITRESSNGRSPTVMNGLKAGTGPALLLFTTRGKYIC
jgi:hypothetical protein